jgi:hypothetical protein
MIVITRYCALLLVPAEERLRLANAIDMESRYNLGRSVTERTAIPNVPILQESVVPESGSLEFYVMMVESVCHRRISKTRYNTRVTSIVGRCWADIVGQRKTKYLRKRKFSCKMNRYGMDSNRYTRFEFKESRRRSTCNQGRRQTLRERRLCTTIQYASRG